MFTITGRGPAMQPMPSLRNFLFFRTHGGNPQSASASALFKQLFAGHLNAHLKAVRQISLLGKWKNSSFHDGEGPIGMFFSGIFSIRKFAHKKQEVGDPDSNSEIQPAKNKLDLFV